MRLSISVIIPVYNRVQFLNDALRSVVHQQQQPTEIFVVDDGSTESIENCLLQYGAQVTYVRQDHRGPAAARNNAIQRAQGDIIAFLDSDDIWTTSHLAELSRCLEADPTVQIAHGRMRNFRDGAVKFWCSPPYHLTSLPSCIYRREVFETVGLLNESMQYGEDVDFSIRCWEHKIKKVKVDHLSLLCRRHPYNLTANQKLNQLGLVAVYKQHLDRVRRGLCEPDPVGFESLKDYLGEGCARYDDGSFEPVDEALFGASFV